MDQLFFNVFSTSFSSWFIVGEELLRKKFRILLLFYVKATKTILAKLKTLKGTTEYRCTRYNCEAFIEVKGHDTKVIIQSLNLIHNHGL